MRIMQFSDMPLDEVAKHAEDVFNEGFDAIIISPLQKIKFNMKEEIVDGKKKLIPYTYKKEFVELHRDLFKFTDEKIPRPYIHEVGEKIKYDPNTCEDIDIKTIPWWQMYQPTGPEIGNHLGTKEDLKTVTDIYHEYGIKVFSDIVQNHVAGVEYVSKEDKINKPYMNYEPHPLVDERIKNNEHFLKWKENIEGWQWKDRDRVIHYCMGVPGVRNDLHEYQDEIVIPLLNEYIDLGIDGFRFDAAKCISTPNEVLRYPEYCDENGRPVGRKDENGNIIRSEDGRPVYNDFWTRVPSKLKKKDVFMFAELLADGDSNLIREYSKYMNVFTDGDIVDENKIIKAAESHDQQYNPDAMNYHMEYIPEEKVDGDYYNLCQVCKNTIYVPRPSYNAMRVYQDRKYKNLPEIDLREFSEHWINNETLKNGNIYNRFDHEIKKNKMQIIEGLDSIRFNKINAFINNFYELPSFHLEILNETLPSIDMMSRWFIEQYNAKGKGDIPYNPEPIENKDRDTLICEFLNTLSEDYAKEYMEWKKDMSQMILNPILEDRDRNSFVTPENALAVIDVKKNINDITEIIHQFIHKKCLINGKSLMNDYFSETLATSVEFMVNDFLKEKGYDVLDKQRSRLDKTNKAAKTIIFEEILLKASSEEHGLNKYKIYDYVESNKDNKDTNKLIDKESRIFYDNMINRHGVTFPKMQSYIFGTILGTRISKEINEGKLSKENLVDAINNLKDYNFNSFLKTLNLDQRILHIDEDCLEELTEPCLEKIDDINNYAKNKIRC